MLRSGISSALAPFCPPPQLLLSLQDVGVSKGSCLERSSGFLQYSKLNQYSVAEHSLNAQVNMRSSSCLSPARLRAGVTEKPCKTGTAGRSAEPMP